MSFRVVRNGCSQWHRFVLLTRRRLDVRTLFLAFLKFVSIWLSVHHSDLSENILHYRRWKIQVLPR